MDDNFTLDKDYSKELVRKIIESKMDISWATPNGIRADALDEELLGLMKKSGLYLISLGIESGSDRILDAMKKGTTVEKIRENVKLIRSQGIDIAGFFIIGFPGETEKDIRQTIRFSLGLDIIRANYFTYLPFPGCTSYNELIEKGELARPDWDKFSFINVAYAPKGLSLGRLKWLKRSAFLRFYIRPRILWKNIRDIKSFRHFKYLLRRFFHWIIMN